MSEGQSGPGSENYYCTVATTSTRPYTPAPALHRPTSSRANSDVQARLRSFFRLDITKNLRGV